MDPSNTAGARSRRVCADNDRMDWLSEHNPLPRRLWPSVEALRRSGVDARVVTVGAARLPEEPWLEQRAWDLEREAHDLASFDLGVMPLDDDEWARGKCGYKLLQYFAAGLPVVASPVGINSKLVGDERGHLAQSQTEWTHALSDLSRDTAARREAGRAAREYVERNFSYERWAPELANLIKAWEPARPERDAFEARVGAAAPWTLDAGLPVRSISR